ncbi:MAG: hypothetical protein MH219_19515 [Marinobacter sp.]|nr:hypothetical protein [Marinobacter sp.]
MHNKSVAELSRELESGKISSVELTREFLDRIKAEDDQYNSFITVTEDLAMADAKAADEQRAAGNASVWRLNTQADAAISAPTERLIHSLR